MDHDVNTKLERPLAVRSREGAVADHARSHRVRELCGARKVGDAEKRIGRRFDPQQAWPCRERPRHRFIIRGIDEIDRDAAPADNLLELQVRAVVALARGNDAITRRQLLEDRHVRRESR